MWLDILLVCIIVIGIVFGIINGAIRELFALGGVVAGIYVAGRFYTRLALILHIENVRVLSFIIIFIIVAIIVYLVGLLVYQLLNFLKLGGLDKLLGMVFGIIKGSLTAGIICLAVALFPEGKEAVKESKIAPFVFKELYWVKKLFPRQIQDKLKWNTPREQTSG